ncbi:MAG: hypothetical protein M1434_08500 [Chloroflexi bacterium]|nr:hypothetical protein [Chloroflexota bacterium]MCL5274768.1 hypothetical protein [Chloroflexota bacterium]
MTFAAGIVIGLFFGVVLGFVFLSMMIISRQSGIREEQQRLLPPVS